MDMQRIDDLLKSFEKNFGKSNEVRLIRAPGRVNLVGEHTDYNGYPVLPVAIDRDITIACASSDDQMIHIVNTNSKYYPRSFHLNECDQSFEQGDWGNYVKASVRGLVEANVIHQEKVRGFNAVYSGNIPESAGLSSSSALVVATAIAFLNVNAIEIDRLTLAEILSHAERFVGTEGGGMDQAISLLGKKGKALKIDFFPLRVKPVQLLTGYSFVVCNSLIRAPKTESARHEYNRRVVECRLAMALLEKIYCVLMGNKFNSVRLADVAAARLGLTEEKTFQIAREAMEGSPLHIDEIARRLGISVKEVEEKYCTLKDDSLVTPPSNGFEVLKRYMHVVNEARRVEHAVQALEEENAKAFGDLMNQSHESCRDNYEVSCPELDALVSIARQNGAIGSRLTGAGFGGCTINILAKESAEEFLQAMWKEFYKERIENRSNFLNMTHINNFGLFEYRSSDGASVISV